jgi:steroid delta-isomerase-like uncharacterized protein
MDPKEPVQRGLDAWNARDLEGFIATYTEDCEATAPGFAGKGQQGIRDFWALWNGAFPDNQVRINVLVAEGSTVAEESTFQGTHTGPLTTPDGGQIPPTDRPVTVSFAAVHTVAGEQVASTHFYFDLLDMLTQIGLAPG